MSPNVKRPLDLKKAFADLTARAAPGAPDLRRAYTGAPEASLRPVRALVPIAAAFALCIGGALVAARFIGSPRQSEPNAAASGSDFLLSPARDQAALGVGLSPFSSESEGRGAPGQSGVESAILSYIEALWTLPGQAPLDLGNRGI